MEYTSLSFIMIFPLFFLIYHRCSEKIRLVLLLLFSYFFVYSFLPSALFLLLCITLLTYCLGCTLGKVVKGRKVILVIGIVLLIGLLFYLRSNISILPAIGVSYYSLQAISYLADVYQEKIDVEKNLIFFALYLAFFPKFISGPIEKPEKFISQVREVGKIIDYESLKKASLSVLWGYFEKVVVANTTALVVNQIFDSYRSQHSSILVLGAMLFAIQLYADFDGYSNIALGIAGMLGFQMTKNFDMPYFAVNITDFWRRWHISLSSWLKDYVYIPLGGNRKGTFRQCINLLFAFAVSGIWHGAGFKYLFWGILHGMYQVAEKLFRRIKTAIEEAFHFGNSKEMNDNPNGDLHRKVICLIQKVTGCMLVFLCVDFAWIFFRASSLSAGVDFVRGIVRNIGNENVYNRSLMGLEVPLPVYISMGTGILIMVAHDILRTIGVGAPMPARKNTSIVVGRKIVGYGASTLLLVMIVCVSLQLLGLGSSGFLYAQF